MVNYLPDSMVALCIIYYLIDCSLQLESRRQHLCNQSSFFFIKGPVTQVAFIMLLTPITGQITHGEKSWAKTNEVTCNQYKPNISVFICDTVSIKDNKIHEVDPYEAEHLFNWDMYTPDAGVAGMLLHINGKFTTWKLNLSLIKKVTLKLWSRSSCISGIC